MRFVIVGCGRVGSTLAGYYDGQGHQVSVVDENEAAFESLDNAFRGSAVKGVGLDVSVLREAGIEHADVCISATDGDNTNLVVAQIAREQFRVPCVVVRVFDPYRADFYREWGLHVICPVSLSVAKIMEVVDEIGGLCET